jgi:FixJ family two-component response regulator
MVADAIVFVVDDDASVRRGLARLVRAAGLAVETFPSAGDFLARSLPDLPGCLVLDLHLPGVDGLELQELLSRSGRDLPVVFLTGYGDVPTTARAMKAGAVDFLEKPFRGDNLLDAIGRALERDRRQRAARAGRAAVQRRLDALTPREREVLALVVAGLINKQIAAELGTGEKTVKVHRGRVMEKMGAGSVAELVRLAAQVGIRGAPPDPPDFPG